MKVHLFCAVAAVLVTAGVFGEKESFKGTGTLTCTEHTSEVECGIFGGCESKGDCSVEGFVGGSTSTSTTTENGTVISSFMCSESESQIVDPDCEVTCDAGICTFAPSPAPETGSGAGKAGWMTEGMIAMVVAVGYGLF